MTTEGQIITFKTAKIAQEKKFYLTNSIGDTVNYYTQKGELLNDFGFIPEFTPNTKIEHRDVPAPTQDQLHKWIREKYGVLIQIYNNASGYLWSLSKITGGTDLGWSEFTGNCEDSKTFKEYEDAFENALQLVIANSLDDFKKNATKNFHWGLYAEYIQGKIK